MSVWVAKEIGGFEFWVFMVLLLLGFLLRLAMGISNVFRSGLFLLATLTLIEELVGCGLRNCGVDEELISFKMKKELMLFEFEEELMLLDEFW